jgi:small GTP-binding protein
MLRQVYIIKDNDFLYEANFGKAINRTDFSPLYTKLKQDALSSLGEEFGDYEYYRYRINYTVDKEKKLFIVFITGLADNPLDVQTELRKLRKEFMNIFGDMLDMNIDPSMFEVLAPTVDVIHKSLRPKISLVGFSGVGKTTITRLIKSEEIPMEHVPTITGDIATIRIGKLHFHLWDFAGQEQFSFLWNKFVKGSDGILLITNSELENIEKSKFFLELIKDEAPYAHTAVIGNKQDLPGALPIAKIEEILGLKTYSMIAIDPDNRDKMIQIIADVLEMSSEISPLLKPLFERDQLMLDAHQALQDGDIAGAVQLFEKISDLCAELGDDSLSLEFLQKSEKLKGYLK